ncbi:hypothetical protein WG78_14545 [Amantichitinum ursilacus]|uniref:Uncharacterized protein n=1 Tax=Amantichitinum ursilacus TaxID=857265 RepID=A0A0N0XK28_9NEIS|nr:hypothetical protein WG78_14545 [Amantichitinum ursilacus]
MLLQCKLYYSANAHVKDPFNDVVRLDAIQKIFVHMFGNRHESALCDPGCARRCRTGLCDAGF